MDKSNFLVDLLNNPKMEFDEPFYTFPPKMFWVEAVRQFVNSVMYLINAEIAPRICYQIVVPTRKDVRFVQHMCRNVKIPVNAMPVESNDTSLPCELSMFSAENWMTRMMPTFGKSRLTYIFCIADGIEYDYRIETVLRILERSSNNSRTLLIPGAIMGTTDVVYKTHCLETNFGAAYQLEKVKRFQPESGLWDTLQMILYHIREMDSRPEVKDILVVTPNMKLAGQLLGLLLNTPNLRRSIIMPSKFRLDEPLRGPENGPFKIICMTPSYIYTDRFPTVNCIVDTCLRKCKTGGEDNLKFASKASIAELASIVGIGKSHFTHCLCVDSKKYINLDKYEKPLRSTREITSTILELENAGINSYPIMTQDENERSQYMKHYTELVDDKFIEKGESYEPLTQRGRFALATRLSRRATIFLDTVFSQCQHWDDPRPNHYPLFVACLTAVWIDLDGGIFMPAITPAAIAIQAEFDWMDSLENFLDIILSFMAETRESNNFTWCVLRGVNYSALLNAISHVRCLLESIQRSWGVDLPRPELSGEYVERGLAIDDKRELMPSLKQTFNDRQYVCYFGQVKNVHTEELAEFSSCVEHIVKQKMCHSGRVFINVAAEQNNGILNKIVFCE
jgi:hypothetical protein